MKKIIFLATFIFVFGLALPTSSFAQGIMGNITGTNNTNLQNSDDHTAREEAEGKDIWEKLQSKNLNCEDLSDDDFGALGEYFMGQMMGDSHEAMNNMMIQMMGEEGEEQMHIAMGKRMSNCEPDASMPQNMMNSGTMPMMGNMMANFGYWGWWGWLGWILMILFWILVIVAIVALIKWLINQIRGETRSKTALDILKERYAKGEISKEEFEEKKRDLI